jgi:hypothetical protein
LKSKALCNDLQRASLAIVVALIRSSVTDSLIAMRKFFA